MNKRIKFLSSLFLRSHWSYCLYILQSLTKSLRPRRSKNKFLLIFLSMIKIEELTEYWILEDRNIYSFCARESYPLHLWGWMFYVSTGLVFMLVATFPRLLLCFLFLAFLPFFSPLCCLTAVFIWVSPSCYRGSVSLCPSQTMADFWLLVVFLVFYIHKENCTYIGIHLEYVYIYICNYWYLNEIIRSTVIFNSRV